MKKINSIKLHILEIGARVLKKIFNVVNTDIISHFRSIYIKKRIVNSKKQIARILTSDVLSRLVNDYSMFVMRNGLFQKTSVTPLVEDINLPAG